MLEWELPAFLSICSDEYGSYRTWEDTCNAFLTGTGVLGPRVLHRYVVFD